MESQPTTQSASLRLLQTSTVAVLIRSVISAVKAAAASSRATATLQSLRTRLTQAKNRLVTWSAAATSRQYAGRVGMAATNATVTSVSKVSASWIESSLLYQWLTEEPDPEVIVIDLRTTRTVGSLIAVLDTIIATLAPYYPTATLKWLIDIVNNLAARAVSTTLGQFITGLLEPPAPPAERTEDTDDPAEDSPRD